MWNWRVMLRFGSRQATLREVLDLATGAVLELDREIQEPVDLVLNGGSSRAAKWWWSTATMDCGSSKSLRRNSGSIVFECWTAGCLFEELKMSLSLRAVLPGVSPAYRYRRCPSAPASSVLARPHCGSAGGRDMKEFGCASAGTVRSIAFRMDYSAVWKRRASASSARRKPNRMPLGLVLLSQGDITDPAAPGARPAANDQGGKLGEWLVKMGAVSEQQVTAALAVQQGCPVFASCEAHALPERLNWPVALTVSYGAVPVFHNPSEETLYVGFLGQVNHAFLYAVEQILHCRTLPCIVPLANYRERLEWNGFETPGETIEILQRQDGREVTETVGSYAQQIRAEHCSVSSCEDRLWVRLESARRSHVDFLFRLSTAAG